MTSGKTKSCGCGAVRRGEDAQLFRHGLSHTPIWYAWQNMKRRCYNPASKDYPNYGGRGIRVCDRWLERIENFYADMGDRPPEMTLDRINVNGNYEPSNCRWADSTTQNRNRRDNVLITAHGKTQTVAAWAVEMGFAYTTIARRLASGLTGEDAVQPRRKNGWQ